MIETEKDIRDVRAAVFSQLSHINNAFTITKHFSSNFDTHILNIHSIVSSILTKDTEEHTQIEKPIVSTKFIDKDEENEIDVSPLKSNNSSLNRIMFSKKISFGNEKHPNLNIINSIDSFNVKNQVVNKRQTEPINPTSGKKYNSSAFNFLQDPHNNEFGSLRTARFNDVNTKFSAPSSNRFNSNNNNAEYFAFFKEQTKALSKIIETGEENSKVLKTVLNNLFMSMLNKNQEESNPKIAKQKAKIKELESQNKILSKENSELQIKLAVIENTQKESLKLQEKFKNSFLTINSDIRPDNGEEAEIWKKKHERLLNDYKHLKKDFVSLGSQLRTANGKLELLDRVIQQQNEEFIDLYKTVQASLISSRNKNSKSTLSNQNISDITNEKYHNNGVRRESTDQNLLLILDNEHKRSNFKRKADAVNVDSREVVLNYTGSPRHYSRNNEFIDIKGSRDSGGFGWNDIPGDTEDRNQVTDFYEGTNAINNSIGMEGNGSIDVNAFNSVPLNYTAPAKRNTENIKTLFFENQISPRSIAMGFKNQILNKNFGESLMRKSYSEKQIQEKNIFKTTLEEDRGRKESRTFDDEGDMMSDPGNVFKNKSEQSEDKQDSCYSLVEMTNSHGNSLCDDKMPSDDENNIKPKEVTEKLSSSPKQKQKDLLNAFNLYNIRGSDYLPNNFKASEGTEKYYTFSNKNSEKVVRVE